MGFATKAQSRQLVRGTRKEAESSWDTEKLRDLDEEDGDDKDEELCDSDEKEGSRSTMGLIAQTGESDDRVLIKRKLCPTSIHRE